MSQSLLRSPRTRDGRVSEVAVAAGRTLWVFMGAVAEFICFSTQFGGDVSEVVGMKGAFSIAVLVYWLSFHSSQWSTCASSGFFSGVQSPQWSRELYLQCPTCMYQLLSLLCKVRVSVSCAERITLMNRAVSPSHVRQKVLLVETSHARVPHSQ